MAAGGAVAAGQAEPGVGEGVVQGGEDGFAGAFHAEWVRGRWAFDPAGDLEAEQFAQGAGLVGVVDQVGEDGVGLHGEVLAAEVVQAGAVGAQTVLDQGDGGGVEMVGVAGVGDRCGDDVTVGAQRGGSGGWASGRGGNVAVALVNVAHHGEWAVLAATGVAVLLRHG